jgi:hypothetical protein
MFYAERVILSSLVAFQAHYSEIHLYYPSLIAWI